MTLPTSAAVCEACREMKKDYPTGLGPMYGDPENNYGKFDIVLTAQAHHRALSEANARVGELEAALAMTPPDAAGCEVDILESGAELHHQDLHRALSEAEAKVGELEEGLRLIRQLNSWGNTTWPNVVERLLKSAKDGRGA